MSRKRISIKNVSLNQIPALEFFQNKIYFNNKSLNGLFAFEASFIIIFDEHPDHHVITQESFQAIIYAVLSLAALAQHMARLCIVAICRRKPEVCTVDSP